MKRIGAILDEEIIRLAKELSPKGQITEGIHIALSQDMAADFKRRRIDIELKETEISNALRAGGITVSAGIRNQILAAHSARINPDRKRIAKMVSGMADLIAEFNEAGL